MMTHCYSVSPAAPSAAATVPTSSTRSNKSRAALLPSSACHRVLASGAHHHQASDPSQRHQRDNILHRRTFALSLASAVLGLIVDERKATAARRPPPPPAEEKKDPNVSGVMAKVLASKKRKEAMKEATAKLRERGKPIN